MEDYQINEVFAKYGRVYKAVHQSNLNVQCDGCAFKKKSKCLAPDLVCSCPPRHFIDVTDEYMEEVTGREANKVTILVSGIILLAILLVIGLTFAAAYLTQKSGIIPGI